MTLNQAAAMSYTLTLRVLGSVGGRSKDISHRKRSVNHVFGGTEGREILTPKCVVHFQQAEPTVTPRRRHGDADVKGYAGRGGGAGCVEADV